LTKAAEAIIAEDSRASLHQRIAELKAEKEMLQRVVDNGIEDYDLLLEGNKSLLAERDDFHYCCEDLQAELVVVCSGAKMKIADLEAKVSLPKPTVLTLLLPVKNVCKILRMDWSVTWQSSVCCMCATLRLSGAYACRCSRLSLHLRIIFDGCLQRYSVF
jgi:hypothetical protein